MRRGKAWLGACLGLLLLPVPCHAAPSKGPVNATAAPARGTAQREAILNALRPSIEAQLGPSVVFLIKTIRVENGWAFVVADPRRKGGGYINGWAYVPDYGDRLTLEVTAILHFDKGRWSLVRQQVGATDVWYCDIGPRTLKSGYGCR